ncbi:MAG: hypothetical protein M1825_006354 [Sarcosagium campestre]|nr:MAG: hypothetical protein M1825_006354 [Sarcosagium campestre]
MLSDGQMHAIQITERITSVLSLLGTFFIIGTFLCSSAFHKPINRLVFYACFGNIAANVGTLMSTSGIEAGVGSPLCQFQAFLIQMFMPADALWTLAMATNVYLTFFRKYNANQLRSMEWKYLIFCYGLPVFPAFVFLFIQSGDGARIYGPATLWCWVSIEWDFLRVATFYAPVWVIMVITITIYTYAGLEIYRKRQQLRKFTYFTSHAPAIIEDPYPNTKTTEIRVTSERVSSSDNASEITLADEKGQVDGRTESRIDDGASSAGYELYSVTVESGLEGSLASHAIPCVHRSHSAMEANSAAWSYARVAFLFFVAMMVTWVPSSVNRVYTLVHVHDASFALSYVSSLVLPLQGFWNAVIYAATSLPACRRLFLILINREPTTEAHQDLPRRTPSSDRNRFSDITTSDIGSFGK